MTSKTGICRFCGQSRLMEVPDGMPVEEVNEEAALSCSCIEGKAYREGLQGND